jgi:putative PEP-CTERM system TPR-repeat lipoprotein
MQLRPIVAALLIATLSTPFLGGCNKIAKATPEEHIQRAKDLEAKADHRGAIIELKSVLQQSPNDAQVRWLLGLAYLKADQGAEAEKELKQAKALGIGADSLMPSLGEALLLQNQYKRLLDEVNLTGNESAINKAKILRMRGYALSGLGKWDVGCGLFSQALSADADYAPAYLGLANCAMAHNDTTEARHQIDIALQKDPHDVKTWLFLGDFERYNNNAQGAESAYSEALKIEPNNEAALASRALTRLSQLQNTQAQSDLDKLHTVAPRSSITKFLEAVFLYQTAKFDASRDKLLQVQQAQPNSVPAQRLLGIVQFKLGNYQEAATKLARYLEQNPADLDVRKLLAATYLRINQPDHSLQVLTPVLASGKPDSQVLALASAAHLGSHDISQATRLMQQASELNPTNVTLHTQLGLNLWAAGDIQQAQQTLEKAAGQDQQYYQADLALTLMYLQKQQFEQALSAATRLEKKRSNDPLTLNLKGAAYLGLKNYTDARKSFGRALELRPTSASAALNLAQLDLRDNDASAARKRFEQILSNDKNNVQAMLGLAGLAAAMGRGQDYLDWVEKAAKVNPPALQPRVLLTQYYLGKNQAQKALAIAREAQTAFPKQPAALELLGTAQLRAGEKDNALVTFKRLVEAAPNSPKAYLNLASVQAKFGQLDASRASLEKALSLNPGYLEAQLALITLEVRASKFNDAMVIAQEIEKQTPDSALGMVLEGDIYMSQKKFPMATEAYGRAWSLGQSGTLAIKRHQAMSETARVKEADSFLQQWIGSHPKEIDTRLYLARSFAKRGDRKQAMREYEALLRGDPNQVAALNNLALLYQEENDPRARATAGQAYKLSPDNPEVADTLGWILLQRGETKKGAEIIQKAASMARYDLEIRYHLAFALAKTGNSAQSRKELQQLLGSGKPFPQRGAAQRLLQSL